MFVTEAELRDQLRRPVMGAQVTVPAGARLSPSAADFVKQWALVTVEQGNDSASADQAALGAESPESTPVASDGRDDRDDAEWDKESVFPVQLRGKAPVCNTCGSPVTHKADGLTQLNAYHFAPKTHPRIKLRGRVDSLHALVLLIQRLAKQSGDTELSHDLGTVAAYCREITSAEYNERPVAEFTLKDWDAEQIHEVTHDPMGTIGISHLTIDDEEPELQHWLNVARAQSREIEIIALETFGSPHHPYGASICHAFNRLSSIFYFLQLRMKAGD